MQASFEHGSEDSLERYALGTLSATETECLEEHLLVCPACQNRLTEMDAYVRAARDAAAILRSNQGLSPSSSRFRGSSPAWKLVWAACTVGGIAGLLWIAQIRATTHSLVQGQQVAVVLQALRGSQDAPNTFAPKGRPLLLQADTSFLPPLIRVELRVVDVSGRVIATYPARVEGSSVSVTIPGGLGEGLYWVRLYSPPAGSELLREYALRIR